MKKGTGYFSAMTTMSCDRDIRADRIVAGRVGERLRHHRRCAHIIGDLIGPARNSFGFLGGQRIPIGRLNDDAERGRQPRRKALRIEALPTHVGDLILEKAQGNPFFVEEVVRALIDAGEVFRDAAGGWRARPELGNVAVPESIQGVILSRVDRLRQETRQVLQSASVIGRVFRRRLLAHVTRQESDLDRALWELLRDEHVPLAARAEGSEMHDGAEPFIRRPSVHRIVRRERQGDV